MIRYKLPYANSDYYDNGDFLFSLSNDRSRLIHIDKYYDNSFGYVYTQICDFESYEQYNKIYEYCLSENNWIEQIASIDTKYTQNIKCYLILGNKFITKCGIFYR